ncbi:hypothetical protein PRZ48_013295 [Zasmidium cellare]|uniref:Xylanolytic transcriptional activator regulatory domain-containing protein n=1 Tax=Zasmidium cellare TaxID=395010 RepID=A0ABR0E461_ZASCE|nr:hypothetical protein PRZ48_013295 [Zasmidium cellare]
MPKTRWPYLAAQDTWTPSSSARSSAARSQPSADQQLPGAGNIERRRVSLSFLLSSTDDKQDYFTEKAIGDEPDHTLLGPTCLTATHDQSPGDVMLDLDQSQMFFDVDMLLMPLELDGFGAADDSLNTLIFPKPWETSLATRIETLKSDLSGYTHSCPVKLSFGRGDLAAFFTVANVQSFATTFCHKRHYQYPIIHWPTFVLEEAPIPLLLAISLTGAAYSLSKENGSKHVANARKFYPVADAYIFDQLEILSTKESDQGRQSNHTLQVCQAALLMYGLEVLMSSDPSMQQVAITKRLPTLISKLRMLDLIGCRHDPTEDWELFLHREQIIRLVAWTYCGDCLATLVSNKPPGFSLPEMSGDLPCEPSTWEVDTALRFESSQHRSKPTHHTLAELVASLLNHRQIDDLKSVPTFHLHVVLCAFQQHIYNLHVTMTLVEQSSRILKALSTWRSLWVNAISSLSDRDRQQVGVAKHVYELECLTKRIVEVAISPEAASSPYLRRIPSSGERIVHEFIRDHVSAPDPLGSPQQKAAHVLTPIFTPAPTPTPNLLHRRDAITTIPVSSCLPYANPEEDIISVCQCSGYDGYVTMQANGSCDVTAVTTVTTSNNLYPFTFTSANSAIIAYETTTVWASGGPPMGTGASSYIQHGKSLTIEINPTASQNVGELTGTSLFTAVSNALVTACGTPTSGTPITTCTPATISAVSYMEGSTIAEGDLELAVPLISVSDPNTMQALVVAVAGAFQANSLIKNNTQSVQAWPDTVCGGETNPCMHGPSTVEMTTINSIAQAIYTSDIASEDSHVQNLQAILAFEKGSAGKAACSKEALIMDSLAAIGAFLAILGTIPGFEWMEAEAEVMVVVDTGMDTANAALAGGAEAVSLACEVSEAKGGE